jgi:hypothetical protein
LNILGPFIPRYRKWCFIAFTKQHWHRGVSQPFVQFRGWGNSYQVGKFSKISMRVPSRVFNTQINSESLELYQVLHISFKIKIANVPFESLL